MSQHVGKIPKPHGEAIIHGQDMIHVQGDLYTQVAVQERLVLFDDALDRPAQQAGVVLRRQA